jgi:TolA-binding protein
MKRFPEAARAFDRFLEVYPRSELSPMALLWSGDNHLKDGETEKAKARLDEVITQYPTSPFAEGARLRVAQYYTVVKSFPEAARAYDRFLETYPKSELRPVALLGSSDSHLKKGDTAAARARLEEIIKQDPTSPFAEVARQRLAQLKAVPSPK